MRLCRPGSTNCLAVADSWVLGAIRFEGVNPNPQNPPILFTSGMKGVKIALEFDSEWDELPFRSATFFAVDSFTTVEDVSDHVVVPENVLDRPFTKVYLSVVGQDVKPDADTIARATEIHARMDAIQTEMLTANSETVGPLMSEYMALREELDGMTLVRKRFPTPLLPIGRVFPGAEPPEDSDQLEGV